MSGDLRVNMILGAALATGLVILGVRELSSTLYATKAPAKPGYAIAIDAGGPADAGAAAESDALPDWGTVLPKADIAAGEATSKKCAACHNFAKGGPVVVGPPLYGVVGRPPASMPGMAYSDGMKAQGAKAKAWTYDELYQFLKNPAAYVPGTKMSFAGIKAGADRVNLIAWLRAQSDSPLAIPAPDPKRAPAAAPAPAAGASAPAATAPAEAKPAKPAAEVPASAAAKD